MVRKRVFFTKRKRLARNIQNVLLRVFFLTQKEIEMLIEGVRRERENKSK